MEFWKDETEPVKAFLALFEAAGTDSELGPGLRKVDQLVWFDYTESGPNCSFYLDTRGGELKIGAGKPADTPDLVMSLSADDAHRSWSNKLDPAMAIALKKIRVLGSATALLKLGPKLNRIAAIYTNVLKDLGWEDKIIK